ncbi:MAG: hydrogenase maturation protease [Candidatus Omnitrophota bacterium]
MKTKRILIIGYGNPLRGDDGAGWAAAERLQSCKTKNSLEILICPQLFPEQAEPVSQADLAIFLDASCDAAPGSWKCQKSFAGETPALPGGGMYAAAFTHSVSPGELLGLARELYGHCPEAYLYTMGGESFETANRLTPAVQSAIEGVVGDVEKRITA